IDNQTRKGALQNLFETIHKIHPRKVIVTVDGDDTLAHERVLERVAAEYSNKKVWMTYGNWESRPVGGMRSTCKPFPASILKTKAFRSFKYISSHLRTFYAKLFHLVKKEDLLIDGIFFPVAWDLAFMFPM